MAQQTVEMDEAFKFEVELSEKDRKAVRAYQKYDGIADFEDALRSMFYDRLLEVVNEIDEKGKLGSKDMNDFEVAVSVLGSMLGLNSRAQREEQAKPVPDADKLKRLKEEHARLWHERQYLRTEDVERVLRDYGPQVKQAV